MDSIVRWTILAHNSDKKRLYSSFKAGITIWKVRFVPDKYQIIWIKVVPDLCVFTL